MEQTGNKHQEETDFKETTIFLKTFGYLFGVIWWVKLSNP